MVNKKQAFTLAEVLLVLAIIGVIAAVTIPSVMQQSSEKKYAALAKKTASTVQNAINLKLATVPVGPGDLNTNLFAWLLDGEEDGTNTLKVVKASADSSVIQLPDGQILWWRSGKCSTPTTRINKLGCSSYAYFYVDLNGSDPPLRTTVDNPNPIIEGRSAKTSFDQIYLNVDGDGRVRLYSNNPGAQEDIRAKKYLGL